MAKLKEVVVKLCIDVETGVMTVKDGNDNTGTKALQPRGRILHEIATGRSIHIREGSTCVWYQTPDGNWLYWCYD